MSREVRRKVQLPKEFVGYTVPMKEVLGVGAFFGERRKDVDKVLRRQARELIEKVFGKLDPGWDEVEKKITDRTLMDFRSYELKHKRNPVRLFGELLMYFESLAYHYYIKRDALRIATDCGIIISSNPLLSNLTRYPMETLIVPSKKGREAVEDFIERLGGHMKRTYDIKIKHPDEISHPKAGDYCWFRMNDVTPLLRNPVNFRLNLKHQRPPETGDIRTVREWFNKWLTEAPQIRRRVVEEVAAAEQVQKFTIPPKIEVTSTSHSTDRITRLLEDRI